MAGFRLLALLGTSLSLSVAAHADVLVIGDAMPVDDAVVVYAAPQAPAAKAVPGWPYDVKLTSEDLARAQGQSTRLADTLPDKTARNGLVVAPARLMPSAAGAGEGKPVNGRLLLSALATTNGPVPVPSSAAALPASVAAGKIASPDAMPSLAEQIIRGDEGFPAPNAFDSASGARAVDADERADDQDQDSSRIPTPAKPKARPLFGKETPVATSRAPAAPSATLARVATAEVTPAAASPPVSSVVAASSAVEAPIDLPPALPAPSAAAAGVTALPSPADVAKDALDKKADDLTRLALNAPPPALLAAAPVKKAEAAVKATGKDESKELGKAIEAAASPVKDAAGLASPVTRAPVVQGVLSAERGKKVAAANLVQVDFAPAAETLPEEAEDKLETLAKQLKATPERRLTLTAYAGTGEAVSAREARRISLSRALAVRGFLIE